MEHTKIKIPKESGPDYFSLLQQHNVVVQANTDWEKRFLDVAAGFPGSMHDSRVLRNSSLYRRIANNELLLRPTARVGGREMRDVAQTSKKHQIVLSLRLNISTSV